MRKVSSLFIVRLTTAAVLLLAVSPVWAHKSPPGCSFNNLIVNIGKSADNVTNGSTVTFFVDIVNPNLATTCDITLGPAGLIFTCPGPDGNPTGTQTVLIPGGTVLPPGFAPPTFSIPCTINIAGPGTVAQARVNAPGAVLHANTLQDDPANIDKTISVNVFRPCIEITKECDGSPFPFGQPIRFRGTVRNCGDVLLNNVTVIDNHAGMVLGPITLAAGASANYTGSYATTGCGRFTNTVTVTAVAPLDTPVTVTDSASAVCEVLCPPDIEVLKEVACLLPGDTCGPFAKVATGVKDTACPAFCYRVRVTNVGPVPIVTLTVTDPVIGGDISSLFGPLPIAPGDFRTAIIKPVVHCVDTPDTVTAEGRSADGQVDVDQDSAQVRVLNINIVCNLAVNSNQLLASGPVQVTLTLRNTGTAPLNVTAINGLPALVDCTSGAPVPVTLPIALAANGTVTITGCTQVECPAGTNFVVTVRAEANDQNGTLCVYNQNGVRITDDTECRAVVECRGACVGTPGFWINHPDAWPVEQITVGGRTYSKAIAIMIMALAEQNTEDKSITLFRQLVAAKLNVLSGANPTCITDTITAADAWLQTNAPNGVPANIRGNSAAWQQSGEALKNQLDRYNNGQLCATIKC